MRDIVLDTDILILLVKLRKLDEFVGRFRAYITVITEYEYLRGEVKAGVNSFVSKDTLEKAFDILYLDNRSVRIASEMWADLVRNRETFDERDLLIGAICIANEIPLWTGNIRHFIKLRKYGLQLVDIDPSGWQVRYWTSE